MASRSIATTLASTMSGTCGHHRGYPLLTLENAVLLSHFVYVSEYAFRAMYAPVVEAIVAFLDHAPIRVLA